MEQKYTEEIVLGKRKNGMAMLLLVLALYVAAVAAIIATVSTAESVAVVALVLVLGIGWCAFGWVLLLGLKVLKPQEALVLTLFGKYIGTLKGEGF